MNLTEKIASFKSVNTKTGEKVLVTTVSGAQIWVPKAQFAQSATNIRYTKRAKGDKYVNRTTGVEGILQSDQNDFVGISMDSVSDKKELLQFAHSIGMNVTLAI